MKKSGIISALLLAPVLVAQEPQSPIVHTESGPCSVFTETRVFVNGKELTPQEVEQFKKLGAATYLKNKVQPVQVPVQAPAPAPAPGVFINGHELPADVAKSLIDNGVLPILQAPVRQAPPTTPAANAPTAHPQHVKMIHRKHTKVKRPGTAPGAHPAPPRPDCHCKPVCQCTTTPGKPSCCAPAPAVKPAVDTPKPFCAQPCYCGPAPKPCTCTPEQKCGPTVAPDCQPAEPNTPVLPTPALDAQPACKSPVQIEAKVIINGKEVQVPVNAHIMKITIGADGKPVVTPVN